MLLKYSFDITLTHDHSLLVVVTVYALNRTEIDKIVSDAHIKRRTEIDKIVSDAQIRGEQR